MDHQNRSKQDDQQEEIPPTSQNPNPFSELAFETYSDLLEDRIILINGDLKSDIIEKVGIPLMQMAQEKGPIQLYINSDGGSINDSQAICDIIETIDNPVITMAFGKAMSAAFDIFLCGSYRICYPNTLFLCHAGSVALGLQTLPAVSVEGKLHEAYFKRWARFYASKTNISEKEWHELLERGSNKYFFPEDALKHGIVHHVVGVGKKPSIEKIKKMKW
jgi:ATP-dependent protease ClpP protease subunit